MLGCGESATYVEIGARGRGEVSFQAGLVKFLRTGVGEEKSGSVRYLVRLQYV